MRLPILIRQNINKENFLLVLKARATPLEDVLQFKAEFEQEYGQVHPTFYQGSYSQVRINKCELKGCVEKSPK